MSDIKQFMRLVAERPEDRWLRLKLGLAFLEGCQFDNAVGELELAGRGGPFGYEAAALLRRVSQCRGRSIRGPSFGNQAKGALRVAKVQAEELGHMLIGTEHILLGLLAKSSGLTARALVSQGANAPRVLEEVIRLVPTGELGSTPSSRPTTVRVRETLAAARQVAGYLGEDEVGPEHLLFAMLGLERCAAKDVLIRLGVDLPALDAEVASRIQQSREVVTAVPAVPRVWALPSPALSSPLRVEAIPAQPLSPTGSGPQRLALNPAPRPSSPVLRLAVAFFYSFAVGTVGWSLLREFVL